MSDSFSKVFPEHWWLFGVGSGEKGLIEMSYYGWQPLTFGTLSNYTFLHQPLQKVSDQGKMTVVEFLLGLLNDKSFGVLFSDVAI